jgi:hypothetical protein
MLKITDQTRHKGRGQCSKNFVFLCQKNEFIKITTTKIVEFLIFFLKCTRLDPYVTHHQTNIKFKQGKYIVRNKKQSCLKP